MKNSDLLKKLSKLFDKKKINEQTSLSELDYDSLKILEILSFADKNFPKLNQLICTLGANGVIVMKENKQYFFEATEAKVVDKTGAGDYFAAGYLFGIEEKLSMQETALIANKSAAHVISEIGVRPEKPFTL